MTVAYTPLPPAPVPGSRDFEVRAGAFLDAMPVFGAEMLAIGEAVEAAATIVDVEGNATVAATAASQASLSAADAGQLAGAAKTDAGRAAASAVAAGKSATAAALSASQAATNALAASGSATRAEAAADLADSEGNATLAQEAAAASELSRLASEAAANQATVNGAAAADDAAEAAVARQAAETAANGAANAVVSQLSAIKTQTEYARDQALDGLGVADNSQILAELVGTLSYALDMALKGVDGTVENRGTVGSTDRAELYALMFGELLDKIGVIGRAISGGDVIVRAGTTLPPPISPASDRDTGLQFPAADVIALLTAGLERLRIDASGRVGIGTNAPSGLLDVADDKIRIRTARTPASATASGTQGEIAWDANYVYVCVATNAWSRAPLSTW